MDKKSIIDDLCQAVIISIFTVGCSMLSEKILKITPPCIQKFDLEDAGKLVALECNMDCLHQATSLICIK